MRILALDLGGKCGKNNSNWKGGGRQLNCSHCNQKLRVNDQNRLLKLCEQANGIPVLATKDGKEILYCTLTTDKNKKYSRLNI